MSGYTKLFNSILASTIWRASDTTRIVWITLLAMSDKDGICEGSIPGLADLAHVSVEDCETALAELAAPDTYSRTSEHEGRRIEPIDGVGWQLLNHAKYRMKMSEDERREYNRRKQAEHRAKEKELKDAEVSNSVNEYQTESMTVNDSQSQSAMSAHTDTESKAEKKREKSGFNKPPTPTRIQIKTNDSEWIELLKQESIYAHIDFDREVRKAQLWIADNPPRKFTKMFFKRWINRIEPSLELPANQKPTEADENDRKAREIIRAQQKASYVPRS